MRVDVPDDRFEYRVGTSMLSEFAAGHSPADVLRELVQNEYDAGGRELTVAFGNDRLLIQGTGSVIDPAGWNRLTVMVGTGLVAGTSIAVDPKVNGIGSKNFGLRSLFLFGDEIAIASDGAQTVLDRRRGALKSRLLHEQSRGVKGVTVEVPFRTTDDGDLKAFDEGRERQALQDMAAVLAPTLVKLAMPKSPKSIATVNVSSERLGYQMTWTQNAQELKQPGSPIVRTVRVEHNGNALDDSPRGFKEIEYSRLVTPPVHLRGRAIPSYFKRAAGRIRLGISFETSRGRLVKRPGIFYYPLGAVRSRTGADFSVSAPFAMNEDRSQLLDIANSDWNAWLLDESARFAVDLLRKPLFERYGSDAYSAIDTSLDGSSAPRLAELVTERLRNEECWPSRATGRTRQSFSKAATLTVPIPELRDIGEFLAADRVLADTLSDDDACRRIAQRSGAKPFSIDSLIRFRCAAEDASGLTTTDTEGAGWHYSNLSALTNANTQLRLATAIDRVRSRLTAAHKRDLGAAATTLTKGGTLAAPDLPLWIVDEALAGVVPPETCLHPALANTKVIAGLCRPFEVSRWAVDVARASELGTADDGTILALRQYLLGAPELSRQAWAAIRSAPILLDHRGKPAAANDLVLRSSPGAPTVEPVLRHLPLSAERNATLVEHLHIRETIRGADLELMAKATADALVKPDQMRSALERHSKLLLPTLAKRLESIAFVETTTGAILPPAFAYERNARTVAALGENHPWPLPGYKRFLVRLNCRTEPSLDDILEHLRYLRDAALPLRHPETVYRLLHEAARQEKRTLDTLNNDVVVWTGRLWVAPSDCLLGPDHNAIFRDALPVLSSPREALAALGVPTRPGPMHWKQLFDWARQATGVHSAVSRRVRDVLLAAYDRLDEIPDTIPNDWPIFLDEVDNLHSRNDAMAHRYVVDDDPVLANALRAVRAPLAFAYPDPHIVQCLQQSRVVRLSDIARLTNVAPGPAVDGVDIRTISTLLSRLADSAFSSATAALATAVLAPLRGPRESALRVTFQAVTSIDVVETIHRHHVVGTTSVTTEADHVVETSRIVIAKARTNDELRRAVARAIASIVEPTADGQRLLADGVYFLLKCRNATDMQRELEQRRIPWTSPSVTGLTAETQSDRDEDEDSGAAAIADAMRRSVMEGMQTSKPTPPPPPSPPRPPASHPPQPSTPRPLPELDSVTLDATDTPIQPRSKAGGSGGGGGAPWSWTPRSPLQAEDDRRLGRRGEELALRWEREKVARRGQDPTSVIWVADTAPAANHDILSIDETGQEIWIEVKSTAGRDGRFSWSRGEFQLAVSKRSRYYLYRVYEADTINPSILEVQDPIGLVESGLLTLDLDVLSADAGSLGG